MAEPDSDRPQLHLGAYALCLDAADRLLLARMAIGPDAGRWTLPGGGVEGHEHPDDAVRRELHEEAGVEGIAPGRVMAIYSRTYEAIYSRTNERGTQRPWGPVHHVGIVYEVTGVGEDLRFERDGSTDRCEWFTRAQVAGLPLVPLGRFGVGLAWP